MSTKPPVIRLDAVFVAAVRTSRLCAKETPPGFALIPAGDFALTSN